jgi:hypothetical protein
MKAKLKLFLYYFTFLIATRLAMGPALEELTGKDVFENLFASMLTAIGLVLINKFLMNSAMKYSSKVIAKITVPKQPQK